MQVVITGKQLTVGETSMRVARANTEALVFQNSVHGGFNVIYRQSDGNLDESTRREILRQARLTDVQEF